MLTLVAVLIATPMTQNKVEPICAVGRAALSDLGNLGRPGLRYGTFYSLPAPGRPDLLTICPMLERELPAEFPRADKAAMARAAIHAPRPFEPTPALTTVYRIEPPQLAADGKSATVAFSYECTGLCAATFTAEYVRTRQGWRRVGPIVTRSVS